VALFRTTGLFLVLRGIKTPELRMQRHCEMERNCYWLRKNKNTKVYWCGFTDHPGYALLKQMRGFEV
jgi:cystathionine beta-lyase/cystathionine gamma-synthase